MSSISILIAEDSDVTRKMIERTLKRNSYKNISILKGSSIKKADIYIVSDSFKLKDQLLIDTFNEELSKTIVVGSNLSNSFSNKLTKYNGEVVSKPMHPAILIQKVKLIEERLEKDRLKEQKSEEQRKQRLVEKQRLEEQKAKEQELKKKQEEQRLKEEQKLKEEQRLKEKQRLEQELKEQQILREQKAKEQEEQRLKEEQRIKEKQRLKAKEEQKLKEQQRLEEQRIKKQKEEQRLKEQQILEEQRLKEEELKAKAEKQKQEEIRIKKEEQKLKEQQRLEEQKTKEEIEKQDEKENDYSHEKEIELLEAEPEIRERVLLIAPDEPIEPTLEVSDEETDEDDSVKEDTNDAVKEDSSKASKEVVDDIDKDTKDDKISRDYPEDDIEQTIQLDEEESSDYEKESKDINNIKTGIKDLEKSFEENTLSIEVLEDLKDEIIFLQKKLEEKEKAFEEKFNKKVKEKENIPTPKVLNPNSDFDLGLDLETINVRPYSEVVLDKERELATKKEPKSYLDLESVDLEGVDFEEESFEVEFDDGKAKKEDNNFKISIKPPRFKQEPKRRKVPKREDTEEPIVHYEFKETIEEEEELSIADKFLNIIKNIGGRRK